MALHHSGLFKDNVGTAVIGICIFSTLSLFLLPPGDLSNIVGNITAVIAVLLGTYFAFRCYFLYTGGTPEGRAWLLFAIGLSLCLFGVASQTVYERTGIVPLNYGLAVLRTTAYVLFVLGFAIKLRFAGIYLNQGQKVFIAGFMAVWTYLVIWVSVLPGLAWNTDRGIIVITYPVLSIAEIFILFVILLILHLDITAKGWIPISAGMLLISVGDTFYTVMYNYFLEHGGYWDGHPYHMIWYIGLFLIAYGAYYQRKIHMELIKM